MSSFYIPEPCHENWNNMTPQEQGRHCGVCNKVVVDFSKKSHGEITSIISKAAEGTVCGHFNINQLDQKEQRNVFLDPRNLFNRNWKYFAMSIFGLFLFNKKAVAQGAIKMRGTVAYRPETRTNTKQTILAGIVSNKEGAKLKDVRVVISSSGREIATAQTDADGFYSFKIEPGKIYNHKMTVVVSHYDYETKTVNDLAVTKEVVRLNMVMDEYMMIMGKVAPVYYEKIKEEEIHKLEEVKKPVDSIIKPQICKESILTNEKSKNARVAKVPEKTVYTVVEAGENKIIEETVKNTDLPAVKKITVKLETNTASVYPNPATTYAIVKCHKPGTYKIELFNAIGALEQSHVLNGDQLQLDIAALQRGTYFVRISQETGVFKTVKLVKD
ncbi:MAG TPA: T9SS type A sorting domain-containing protein [Flavobacteriales bacterium]|nr:T9SS type A sorting domain-containing protein [Flavobacteriales bacterium]